ncbi:MAG: methylmalonyl-CoA epimerase [Balneolales bacterium]
MKTIEHLGIAVKDLNKAVQQYEKLLDSICYKRESVESEKVDTAFFKMGGSKLELLAATEESSVIAGFIAKKGEGMHHVAFEVEDIVAEIGRLKAEGFTMVSDEPKSGADNKLVAFVHPKNSTGMLIELCQERKTD